MTVIADTGVLVALIDRTRRNTTGSADRLKLFLSPS